MQIKRRFTTAGKSPYEKIPFRRATSEIKNPDGSVVFKCENFAVPEHWSQVAADILAQKYFRKAGVPARLKRIEETQVPSWLWRSAADERALAERPAQERSGGETDARQVFDRLAGTWTYWGWKGGYFTSEDDARAFFDEHRYMLAMQYGAPNSPQWFNTGLHWAYGIDGPSQGHYYVDHETGELTALDLGLRAPPAARLLHPVDRGRPRQRERHHGPVGARGAPLQVRLRHRLQLLQAARREREALRRRQVVRPDELPQDRRPRRRRHQVGRHHAARRQDGGGRHRSPRHRGLHRLEGEGGAEGRGPRHRLQDLPAAAQGHHEGLRQLRGRGEACFDPAKNPALKRAIKEARRDLVPDNYIRRVIQFARQGYTEIEFADLRHRLGQRGLPHRLRPELQQLRARDRRVPERGGGGRGLGADRAHSAASTVKTLKARDLWEKIGHAAWASADPGIQFHTTINDWHTCPKSGPIRASNPCSEYMFLDDTACNLASLNLMRFRDADKRFDVAAFEHACRLWTIALEISVLMAQFPSKKIAELSYRYRTLGLGFANIGGCLMASGIPYDSAAGPRHLRRPHRPS